MLRQVLVCTGTIPDYKQASMLKFTWFGSDVCQLKCSQKFLNHGKTVIQP